MTFTDLVPAADPRGSILPYSLVVGQEELKTALEVASVMPSVGGVLATGQRGTAKTTTVRSFAVMLCNSLPVTLPIGATDDRVLGGWEIKTLIDGDPEPQAGLLEEASRSPARMLYIDEINLLDDYLVNIILDTVSTGILTMERDHRAEGSRAVSFTLIGTMNPDEGGLRPQLLDRFGLVAPIVSVADAEERRQILETVLRFEAAGGDSGNEFIAEARRRDVEKRTALSQARKRVGELRFAEEVLPSCARLAAGFQLAGHRGELALVRAARALAAIEDAVEVNVQHVRRVAKLALVHRRSHGNSGTIPEWTAEDEALLSDLIPDAGR